MLSTIDHAAGPIARRLGSALLLLVAIVAVVFLLARLAPGDPARAILGVEASAADVDAERRRLGLDEPLLTQFWRYLWHAVRGDLGTSYVSGDSVSSIIGGRLPVTLWLLIPSVILSWAIAIPSALIAARHRRGFLDSCIRAFTAGSIAIPTFWLGLLLILAVALPTGMFPVGGFGTGPFGHLRSIVLPAITLAVGIAPIQIRVLRAEMIYALDSGYAEAAASRQVPGRRIMTRHALPNAVIPVIAVSAVQAGYMLFGSVIVENTFQLPGLGSGLVMAVSQRDYPVIDGITLVFGALVVIFSLVGDGLTALLDPRVRANA